MNNLKPLMSSARTGETEKDEWMTPLYLFNMLDRKFNFTLDPCATKENALCDKFFTEKEDGLIQSWKDERVFVNPPYSNMKKWVSKGWLEAKHNNALVVMLVAARTDTITWHSFVRYGEVFFIKGRIKFDLPEEIIEKIKLQNIERKKAGLKEKSLSNSAPFPSAILIFRPGTTIPSTSYIEI